ncbi:MAG: hypothetical protein ACLQGV_15975 [Bryobacteraceae bacterium]
MSEQRESRDELQELWQRPNAPDEEENLETTIEQVLEQDRKYQVSARRKDMIAAAMMLALFPVVLWAATYGKWPLVRAGYGLMAVGLAVSAVAPWLHHRLNRQPPRRDLSVREHLEQSVGFLDRQATFLRAGALICGLPLFLGLLVFGVGIWNRGGKLAGALFMGLSLVPLIGSWRPKWDRKMREIAQKKAQAEELLRRLG